MFKFTPIIKRAPEDEGAGGTSPDGNEATASTNDILSTLRHDPFPGGKAPEAKPDKVAKAPKAKSADSKAAGDKTGGGAPADGGGSDTSQPAGGPAPDPEKEALRESNRHAAELLEAYKRGGSQPAAEPKSGARAPSGKAGTAPQDDSAEPTYNFNIPDQLVQALTSDDVNTFKTGVAGFAQGIGQGVHKQVTQYIEKQLPKMMEKMIPAMIQSHMQSYNSRKAIFDDFYGTYKELNNPTLYPVISDITGKVMQEMRTDKWSPAIRDTVAKRVKEFISSIGGNAAPANGNTQLPKHPVLGGGNNSRPAPEPKNDVAADIMDTLFTGFGN